MLQQFVRLLNEEFEQALKRKTSWGKNEVKLVHSQCVSAALLKLTADLPLVKPDEVMTE